MILGYDFWGDAEFESSCALNNFNRLDLSNSIVDELYLDSDITKSFSTLKDDWQYTTVMDAKFQGDLEAGSVNGKGVPIEQIKFRRRKTDSLLWQDIAIFDFDMMVKIYTFVDNIIASNEDYEYCLVPLTQGVIGNSITGQIHTSFDGTWISNTEKSYQLLANLEYSAIENVFPTTIIETFSKYPIILSSPVDYKKSTLKCKVLTSEVIENNGISQSDIKPLKQLKDNMFKFFKSRKPFILKSANGDYYMVSLMNFKESPDNDLKGMVSGIQFDWVEVGDIENLTDLKNNGLAL